MTQKINLNASPYYDDYDSEKNFHKVLYKPGFPVQARELTSQQSILQNQIESFGDHIFKDGSVVIPGGIAFDNQYNAVKLNNTNFNVDISVYIKSYLGWNMSNGWGQLTWGEGLWGQQGDQIVALSGLNLTLSELLQIMIF